MSVSQACNKLYNDIVSLNSNLDNISVDLWHSGSALLYTKIFNICICICSTNVKIQQNTWSLIETLPKGYRPTVNIISNVCFGNSANIPGVIKIQSTGEVYAFCSSAGGDIIIWGNCSFPSPQ